MRDRRLAAWQLSEELGLPLGTEEEARRWGLRVREREPSLPLPPQVPAVQRREALSAFFLEHMTLPETPVGGLIVHQDGSALWQTLDDTFKSQGVIFCALDTAVQHYPDLVQTHFMTEAVPVATSKFTALHCALWNGGTFLYVPPGVAVQLPLQALMAHMTVSGMEQSHVLLIADTHSQVTFVQEDVSGSAELPGLHNGVVELYLKAGAQVTCLQ